LNANFIVLGSHGRTGLDRLVMGSVAEGVVRAAPVPVMVFPCRHHSG
jgi:nucleotide-binding universal stress UspA family protein